MTKLIGLRQAAFQTSLYCKRPFSRILLKIEVFYENFSLGHHEDCWEL